MRDRTLAPACLALMLVAAGFAGVAPVASASQGAGSGTDDGCDPDPVYVLGISADTSRHPPRDDFVRDIDNFRFFVDQLRTTHCIPTDQVRFLAFQGDFQVDGETVPAATEANLRASLEAIGETASHHEDARFFYFQTSHGITYPSHVQLRADCAQGPRPAGSLASLEPGGGHDGEWFDCDLGHLLDQHFDPGVEMFLSINCSLCGGFSDSLTAVSGTLPDNGHPTSSGVPGPNRVVLTGCSMTTECFGAAGEGGGMVMNVYLRDVLEDGGTGACDGWTAPGFPDAQGFDAPVRDAAIHRLDGTCTASEWFFSAVSLAYARCDAIATQMQPRIKYGFDTLSEDLAIAHGPTFDANLPAVDEPASAGPGDRTADGVAVSPDGDADACVSASGTERAGTGTASVSGTGPAKANRGIAASGTGPADSEIVAVTGTGDAGQEGGANYAVSATGNASGIKAVSGTGDADGCQAFAVQTCMAVSGTGDASGFHAASGTGDADGQFHGVSGTGDAEACRGFLSCTAVSGTGDASGAVAVSGTGHANGSMVGVSACNLDDRFCIDPG